MRERAVLNVQGETQKHSEGKKHMQVATSENELLDLSLAQQVGQLLIQIFLQ